MKIKNTMGNRYSGTLGKAMVASSWKGIRYLREYKIPADPKTESQLRHRGLFARAVEAWHALDPRQRDMYNKTAVRMTGYNLFIKEYIETVRDGREPKIMLAPDETPHIEDKAGEGTSEDGHDEMTDCPETLSSIFE